MFKVPPRITKEKLSDSLRVKAAICVLEYH